MKEVEDLKRRVAGLREKAVRLDGVRSQMRNDLARLGREQDEQSAEIMILEKTMVALRTLMDNIISTRVRDIERLVTSGLRSVFDDQKLSCTTDLSVKRGKVHIDLLTSSGKFSGRASESFGGSVLAIESFLLRLVTVVKMGLARFLVLDEPFSHVSQEYLPATAELLRNLSEKMKMKTLLVTHQHTFMEYAHRLYRMDQREGCLVVAEKKVNE